MISAIKQNSHLTYKGNVGATRHDWLRLTPAYSYRLVAAALEGVHHGIRLLDPFGGTGTTGLVAAEHGMRGWLLDLNPFLVWLSRVKTRNYAPQEIEITRQTASAVVKLALKEKAGDNWIPPLYAIGRWWSKDPLIGLCRLRKALSILAQGTAVDDLLALAFCRVAIAWSNAAFNHQSMSFKATDSPHSPRLKLFDASEELQNLLRSFSHEVEKILSAATTPLPGQITVELDDARQMNVMPTGSVDWIYTSPPYANRISYIRELRPYMYWLGFLTDARQAGELDWAAIGGTWGIATSRLATWVEPEPLPLMQEYRATLGRIREKGSHHAMLLAKYIEKYFSDMYQHFNAAYRVLTSGGRATYIVGNSVFYGNVVPTEKWYGELLCAAGFQEVNITPIRKRNSKAQLFEFEVTAKRP